MKIGYYPFKNKENKYIEMSKDVLKESGHYLCDLKIFMNWKSIDLVILNWYESVGNSKNFFVPYLRFLKRIILLFFMKCFHIKIVYTFHNKVPHEAKHKIISLLIMKFTCKLSDRIIILSSGSDEFLRNYLTDYEIKRKIALVPHPNYIGEYNNLTNYSNGAVHKENYFNILFIGQVRHYKNVELIIEAAKKYSDQKIHFIIAGKPESESYKLELEKLTERYKNITLILKFIEDSEIGSLIKNSDIILLPYDLTSSMNSGTVILAFSYAKTVICPAISTLNDFDKSLVYSYEYNSQNEHLEKLDEMIKKSYLCWKNSPEEFYDKGERLYECVKKENSKENIMKCYKKLLNEITNKKDK